MIKLDVRFREKALEAFKILMGRGRSSMKQKNLHGTVAEPLGPDLVSLGQLDHLDACRLDRGGSPEIQVVRGGSLARGA